MRSLANHVMSMRVWLGLALAITLATASAVISIHAQQGSSDGWQIPAGAASERNPVALNDAVLAAGRQVFRSRCTRCHGPGGKGDGQDADPDHPPNDLTDPARAGRNPDGVMFYKVWNGRKKPKMPAFSAELSKDEAWTVVHYVKTLRR